MGNGDRTATARAFMDAFAEETGLTGSGQAPRRYLWTDAFAVCNFLELDRLGCGATYRQLAVELVDQVHEVLGRHRDDDARSGWISGLSDNEARAHPTKAGLRIGKKLGERAPDEAFDDRLEWERDGQYYHYLTKWAHALCQVAAVSKDIGYRRWAFELGQTMHRRFCHAEPAGKRLYWKMSIDLGRPQVDTMGHHDPLDGLVTFSEICHLAGAAAADCSLDNEITELTAICRHQTWATADLLGLGGLLFDAHRIMQICVADDRSDFGAILAEILRDCASGVDFLAGQNNLASRAEERLAFRELGLAIGLHAVPRMVALLETTPRLDADGSIASSLERLAANLAIGPDIEDFWSDPVNQRVASWQGHEDINKVMLATSLIPHGFLELQSQPMVLVEQLTAES